MAAWLVSVRLPTCTLRVPIFICCVLNFYVHYIFYIYIIFQILGADHSLTKPPIHSTPSGNRSLVLHHLYSPIYHADVEEATTSCQHPINISRMESVSMSINPEFGMYAGDPSDSISTSSESLNSTR